jgi:starch-binding outer membrane protein, SusD/RagB family
MKNIFIKITFISIVFASFYSCSNYDDVYNQDPDLLVDSDAKNLFQGVLLANQFFQTSSVTRDAMIWLNQANGENRQYVALNNWNSSTASAFDDSWNTAYVNCITQAKITQQKAAKEVNPKLKGAAQVIEAHCMGTVTSLWGDAPYSQLDITGNTLTPKYDSQVSIYNKMQILLDDAIINLNSTVGSGIPKDKDLYFDGDAAKWIKLAYSLKARFYLHFKDYANAKANALLGIDSADGDFKAKFGSTGSTQDFNPFYSFLVYERDDYMSGNGYAARLLDPTAALYRGNSKTDESARFAFTYNQEYFSPYSLNIYGPDYGGTSGKFGNDSPMPMVTYGEMLLIIAEADSRNSFASGLTSYNNYRALINTGYSIGIDNLGYESNTFSYLVYDIADFAAGGIENPSPSISDQNALLREILQERYIYFMGSFEGFNDFGRTNNIAEIQLKTGYSGSAQRFLYPQVEINANPNTPRPIPSINTKTPVHL